MIGTKPTAAGLVVSRGIVVASRRAACRHAKTCCGHRCRRRAGPVRIASGLGGVVLPVAATWATGGVGLPRTDVRSNRKSRQHQSKSIPE